MCQPPYPLGVLDMSTTDAERYRAALVASIGFTSLFNSSGHPAMSMPLATSSRGAAPRRAVRRALRRRGDALPAGRPARGRPPVGGAPPVGGLSVRAVTMAFKEPSRASPHEPPIGRPPLRPKTVSLQIRTAAGSQSCPHQLRGHCYSGEAIVQVKAHPTRVLGDGSDRSTRHGCAGENIPAIDEALLITLGLTRPAPWEPRARVAREAALPCLRGSW